MSSVNDFVSNFSVGARANLYKVQIDGLDQKIEFTCKAAQIPGKTINPIEVKYLSNTIKVAGDAIFEDWAITVLNDEDYIIRRQLDEWQELIKKNADATGAGNLSDYFRGATVIQLNRDGSENANAKYKFVNMWPTSVDPMDLGFENADTILEFGVTFSYSFWEKA
jgi:hypothetical protein